MTINTVAKLQQLLLKLRSVRVLGKLALAIFSVNIIQHYATLNPKGYSNNV